MGDAVSKHLGATFPLIGINASLEQAREALAAADALLVTEGGKPVSVLTRPDLLGYLSTGKRLA
jgi:cystathionine beta-synthase